MRLNLGCGNKVLPGWVNVDVVDVGQEYVCDLMALPFDDDSADEAMAIHVIEHFYVWDVPALLAEWRRVLRPGATLILECPDLNKIVRNLVDGDRNPFHTLLGLYGDIRHQNAWHQHKWCWTPPALAKALLDSGFSKAIERPARFHKPDVRDMRVEAVK